jgi:uncharacterized protein YbcV (DUF1398 family)
MKHHYTYRITNLLENKHYYGVRSSICNPVDDIGVKYFSSSCDKAFKKDQQENPGNYRYKVIRISGTRINACKLEELLHEKFDVGVNKSFYNLVKAKNYGYDSTGVVISEARRNKVSEFHTGRKNTEATKKKMSESAKGKKKTKEHCENLRKAGLGRKNSPESIRKTSLANTGRKHTEESKKKMSDALKGISCSEEAKAKISATLKLLHENIAKDNIKNGIIKPGKFIIEIYDGNDNLIDVCKEPFKAYCKKHNYPLEAFKYFMKKKERMYNGLSDKRINSIAQSGNIKYRNWVIIKKGVL